MNNPPTHRPQREEQAFREIGRSEISRPAALGLAALFLLSLGIVPLVQAVRSDSADAFQVALEAIPAAAKAARTQGLLAGNRVLLGGIDDFEDTLEEESLLRELVLPPTQRVLTEVFGVGNEEAYLGRDGWLFLRDDFDHVTGRGFLDPNRLRRERLASPRSADPLPAILALERDLAARGIELLVLPTPVKPTVHPEQLTPRVEPGRMIQNASYGEFLERLRTAGIEVFDPSSLFVAAKNRSDAPLYLETDTHWAPTTMELVAGKLAARLEELADWRQPRSEPLFRRSATVAGGGDIARLLHPPKDGAPRETEQAEISRVVTRRGTAWKPERDAEILLLGDSFTNIYSDPSLGWGASAGLAEQLSFELGRGVDRIALNAGGAWSSRQALARASGTAGNDRLAGKVVVVYQFATRELSSGDWKLIAIPGPGS